MSGSFLLFFFDWNSIALSERSMQFADEAVLILANRPGSARIEMAGHSDLSEPEAEGLSRRRVEAVAAAISARGVSRSRLRLVAFGATRPLVPTGVGIPEPQNRRVELVHRWD
ncbi:OmpA family protein [Roseomonas sp. CCTCC AB2023176]|uniref:OmpA family protein n=1 Tax=Roseomonas sp. CCTCC AB2023176 TaxID=3342640 RepID=UPI0035DCF722